MITGEICFKFKLKTTIPFEWCRKKFVKNGYLKSRNLSEEKKTHPEHKYSVTFESNKFEPQIAAIVPTFDTKVTENLCSGGFFFLQTNFDFLNSHFWRNFFFSFERYCCPEVKFEKIFHLWSFFLKIRGFKDRHFGQFGTINARYISRY